MNVPDERSELPDDLHRRIVVRTRRGDRFLERGEYARALEAYNDALELVPDPRTAWNAARWILIAIGDAAHQGGWFEVADAALTDVMLEFPECLGNAFVHLRLGQARYELGDLGTAANELLRAYANHGIEIFDDEDPKYLAFLRTHAEGVV